MNFQKVYSSQVATTFLYSECFFFISLLFISSNAQALLKPPRVGWGCKTGETGEEMDAYFFISPQTLGVIQVASTLRILL
jgi:hypothetical protein